LGASVVTEAPVVGAAEGDCALALSTIKVAPIARKMTIAVSIVMGVVILRIPLKGELSA
jgi:hypothetical protein